MISVLHARLAPPARPGRLSGGLGYHSKSVVYNCHILFETDCNPNYLFTFNSIQLITRGLLPLGARVGHGRADDLLRVVAAEDLDEVVLAAGRAAFVDCVVCCCLHHWCIVLLFYDFVVCLLFCCWLPGTLGPCIPCFEGELRGLKEGGLNIGQREGLNM